MTQSKLTWKRGGNRPQDIIVAAGTAIAGSDAIEVNIDATRLTKSEAMLALQKIGHKILASPFPLPNSGDSAVPAAFDGIARIFVLMGDSLTAGNAITDQAGLAAQYTADPKTYAVQSTGALVQFSPGTFAGLNATSNTTQTAYQAMLAATLRADPAYANQIIVFVSKGYGGRIQSKGPQEAVFTGFINNAQLTVVSLSSGSINTAIRQVQSDTPGTLPNAYITSLVSGVANSQQAVLNCTTVSGSATVTVNSVTSGSLVVGQPISGTGLPGTLTVQSFGTFNGTSGTIVLSAGATSAQSGTTLTATGAVYGLNAGLGSGVTAGSAASPLTFRTYDSLIGYDVNSKNFSDTKTKLDQAKAAALGLSGITGTRLVAVAETMGTNDQDGTVNAGAPAAYQAAAQAFWTRIAAEWGFDGATQKLMFRAHKSGTSDRDLVRASQAAVRDSNGVKLINIDDVPLEADGIHPTKDGANTMGSRLKAALGGSTAFLVL